MISHSSFSEKILALIQSPSLSLSLQSEVLDSWIQTLVDCFFEKAKSKNKRMRKINQKDVFLLHHIYCFKPWHWNGQWIWFFLLVINSKFHQLISSSHRNQIKWNQNDEKKHTHTNDFFEWCESVFVCVFFFIMLFVFLFIGFHCNDSELNGKE